MCHMANKTIYTILAKSLCYIEYCVTMFTHSSINKSTYTQHMYSCNTLFYSHHIHKTHPATKKST